MTHPGGSDLEQKRRLPQDPGWWGAECASHNVETAPGYKVFVSGILDGRLQTLALDPDEIDELAKRLHQAKRHSRSGPAMAKPHDYPVRS